MSDPFFSNDTAGLIKVFGVIVSILTPVLAVVYRLTFNQARAEMRDLKKDLNGYGDRLNTIAIEIGAVDRQLQSITIAVARLEENTRRKEV